MTAPASIAIGVPTYNRKTIIELCAHSVRLVDYPENARMIVVDDASVEFDATFLRDQYPPFAEIVRRQVNSGGADFATPDLLERLVDTGADILVIIDSDLILKRNCLRTMLSLIDRTEGVLSLFNTPNHWALRDKGDLLQKRSIGAAATAWRRDLAASVLKAVEPGSMWDWRVCDFLTQQRIPIFTVKDSLVQHLGFAAGENSHALRGDVGLGYYDDDFRNAYNWINEVAAAQQNSFKRVKLRLDELEVRLSKLEKYSPRTGFRLVRNAVRRLVSGRPGERQK
jgi:glycosyltransferase involved in cell wall biosynthesis